MDGPPLPEPKKAGASTEKGSETILLVEDQAAVRAFTNAALATPRLSRHRSAGGEEAIAVAGRHPGEIHLLLTDVVLPGMNGKELSERLKVPRPDVKVLFTSGYPRM